jgi:hypothetical protein
MQVSEVVAEIRQIRVSVDNSARRLAELSQALHRLARRQPVSDAMSPYIAYANAWGRFANMVGLGLRRTATADRFLAMIKSEEPQEKEPAIREPEVRDDDFETLYGETLNV